MVYLTLFSIAFLSATLLPMGSEALLLYDYTQGYAWFGLWLVATVGNTLGSVVNYVLGYKGEQYLVQKGHLSTTNITKFKGFFDRYGGWTLLLSWVPIIGDPLTFVAGVLRYSFGYFVMIVMIAKGLRYASVIFLASSLSV
ncbi:MAG: YqaA family protein [Sulfurovum sp.]|nr:YqaA family protein [Sulfurovum sp.]